MSHLNKHLDPDTRRRAILSTLNEKHGHTLEAVGECFGEIANSQILPIMVVSSITAKGISGSHVNLKEQGTSA